MVDSRAKINYFRLNSNDIGAKLVGILQMAGQQATADIEDEALAESAGIDTTLAVDNLAAYIKKQYEIFRQHRTTENLPRRYLDSLRQYNGNYGPDALAKIKQFGGSEIFARLTAVKCRGATALLRDVYLSGDRPWELEPTPVPNLPDTGMQDIEALVQVEVQSMQGMGQPLTDEVVQSRRQQLQTSMYDAIRRQASAAAKRAEDKVDDILVEGKFYDAFSEFLTDIAIFPFACMEGPVVQNSVEMTWDDQGQMVTTTKPRMSWRRVSPFDIFFSPGASTVSEADAIERVRLRRADLNSLLGLPGYNDENILAALDDYEHGLHDWLDDTESEQADEESRENPHLNRSELITTLKYNGAVKGSWLLDYGFTDEQVEDSARDYYVTAWIVGQYTIKVQINPNPRKRHNYYLTSFEKVPGSIYGNALPETIRDIQSVCNAALRSLVNNMSIASGPQVVVNQERLAPTVNADSLYPWKRWCVLSDPMGLNEKPVEFFQPVSNSAELLNVYKEMAILADEVSAIPRYATGSNNASGGAASTASGLSMLMNNASKVLQNVAASIDNDVLKPVLQDLYTMVMLTDDTGMLRGDENINVRGVSVAMQRETDRMRKLEFMQLTMNPLDQEIVGIKGRAAVLRSLADELGLPSETIVPSEADIQARLESQAQIQQQGGVPGESTMAAQGQGAQPPAPGSTGKGRAGEETDNMMRTNPAGFNP